MVMLPAIEYEECIEINPNKSISASGKIKPFKKMDNLVDYLLFFSK